MPDSSPHSHTHLGNFCAMSIWFSLPLNLPASDPEKMQVRNRGKGWGWWTKQKAGWGGWPLGVKVEVREQQESGNLSLGLDQLLEGAIQIYYRMTMTKPGPGGQRNLYHSMQSFKRHLLWGGGESENVGGMNGWGQIKGSREGTAQATPSVKGTEAQGRERAWSRRTSSSVSSIMELAAPCP